MTDNLFRFRNTEQGTETRSAARRFAGPALILLAAAVATLPQMVRGPSCGHDFDFHLVSWIDALSAWRHGILYPHWTPSANFGAGEPRFLFYPPLTWMLGAFLGILLPWRVVPMALLFLLFAAAGLATRALARQAFDEGIATLAGATAIFSGYALFTAYERSAYAEMAGGFWVPLMLLLVLRGRESRRTLQQDPGRYTLGYFPSRKSHPSHSPREHGYPDSALSGSAIPLALAVAGAWLSNAPLGVMLTYLLAAMALLLALLDRSWAPLFRAAIAAALGLGLAAFFLVPADWEQRWVAIRQAVDDPGLLIENSWLFARHADPRLQLHDVELARVSWIGVAMIAVALLGLAIAVFRKVLPRRRWWIPLAVIPVAVLFLLLPVSGPVWRALPKLRFLQFPWRWLVVLEAPMAIFFAAAIWVRNRVWRLVVAGLCAAVFLGATMVAGRSFFQVCDQDDAVSGMLSAHADGTGFEGTDEYAPPGADNTIVATGLPWACLVDDPTIELGNGDLNTNPDWSADQHTCDATYSPDARNPSPDHVRLVAATPHAGYLILRLRTYPAWRVRLNGQDVGSMPQRDDGLMAVPVPPGPIRLTVDWTTTRDVLIGRLISVAALLLITALWLLERRRIRPRL